MNRQSQPTRIAAIFCLTLTLALTAGGFVFADVSAETATDEYYVNLDNATATKGYTVKAFDGRFNLIFPKKALKNGTGVKITELDTATSSLPWQLEKLSQIFQYELTDKAALNGSSTISLEIKYDRPSNYYKQIYFYDNNHSSWRPLVCRESVKTNSVKCDSTLGFARVAVFANTNTLVVGKASWYSYKKGDFAASPDFPKGSKLRVTNLDNGKSVEVEVNDFGPEKRKHPDRPVDLAKQAFKKIAPLSQGTARIRVEPLMIKPAAGRLLGISAQGAKSEPSVTSKSAVVMDEATGEILWQKNASSTRPLASLSKLVAIKVFLDTRPTLSNIVSYSVKDEEYNYEYANKWESAKLTVKDGDTLSIEDLLYSALVGSANNAIETLVRVSGLSRDDFIKTMNQEAADWGATATSFVEPTGLSPDNVSSALDYAIITKEVYKNPIIQKASTMNRYVFKTRNTKKEHKISNTDKLLAVSSLNITGSKTGYLNEAQYCLMARAAARKGRQIIAVTMGTASRQQSFDETEELLKYGLKQAVTVD